MTYLHQIPKLRFKPVTPAIFKTIRYEGLDEEMDRPLISQWSYAELKISGEDKRGLKSLTPAYIEKFNRFDIALKEKYKLHLIDFIDYNTGTVLIVRWR